jgi:hypothetical protein
MYIVKLAKYGQKGKPLSGMKLHSSWKRQKNTLHTPTSNAQKQLLLLASKWPNI